MENAVNKQKLQDLVNQIDSRHTLDPEVEELLSSIAEDFIDSVTSFSCELAKHRGSDTLEAKDLQLHLEKNWNMQIPGYTSAEPLKPLKKAAPLDIHAERMMAVRQAMARQPK
eukprot:TRINITY_DN914_c0_g1_i1.p1 TRINITY_DN914_c0_g1~~TRINITY_DN914_c0_g1_i1.p1  ORF type:complete len:113 (+),score=10.08 TRINITY_DN914_c0_g1_i1:92-430(+)